MYTSYRVQTSEGRLGWVGKPTGYNCETVLCIDHISLLFTGLNGAMSNIGIRGAGAEVGGASPAATGVDEFHCFILDEMSRRLDSRKRTSNKDVIADSPTRKRSKRL